MIFKGLFRLFLREKTMGNNPSSSLVRTSPAPAPAPTSVLVPPISAPNDNGEAGALHYSQELEGPFPFFPFSFFFFGDFSCTILGLALLISHIDAAMSCVASEWVVEDQFLLLWSRRNWKVVVFSGCEVVWLSVLVRLSVLRLDFCVLIGGIRNSRRAGGWNCTILLEFYLFLLLLFNYLIGRHLVCSLWLNC